MYHKIEYLHISDYVYKKMIRTGVSGAKLRIRINKIGLYITQKINDEVKKKISRINLVEYILYSKKTL